MSTTPDTATAPDAAVRVRASLVAAVEAAQTTYRIYETRVANGDTGWDTSTAEAELTATAELAQLYSALSNEVPEPFATALRHACHYLEQHGMELDQALAEDFDGDLPDAGDEFADAPGDGHERSSTSTTSPHHVALPPPGHGLSGGGEPPSAPPREHRTGSPAMPASR
jgi:hypothetical protein